jgi:hypothetical protein
MIMSPLRRQLRVDGGAPTSCASSVASSAGGGTAGSQHDGDSSERSAPPMITSGVRGARSAAIRSTAASTSPTRMKLRATLARARATDAGSAPTIARISQPRLPRRARSNPSTTEATEPHTIARGDVPTGSAKALDDIIAPGIRCRAFFACDNLPQS